MTARSQRRQAVVLWRRRNHGLAFGDVLPGRREVAGAERRTVPPGVWAPLDLSVPPDVDVSHEFSSRLALSLARS
jgi:hypothetical protein